MPELWTLGSITLYENSKQNLLADSWRALLHCCAYLMYIWLYQSRYRNTGSYRHDVALHWDDIFYIWSEGRKKDEGGQVEDIDFFDGRFWT